MQYPDMFKNAMIQKMTGPGAISASALSRQVDVPQATLSKWLRMAGVGSSYNFPNNSKDYTNMAKINNLRRPNNWSANVSAPWKRSSIEKTKPWQKLQRCWFLKKSPGDLGGRGRPHSREQLEMIINLIDEAVNSGAPLRKESQRPASSICT